MKRTLGLILALMMVLSLFASNVFAEAITPDTTLSGEITHWVWGDYEQKGASDFNKYYPNIKVNYVFVPQDEYTTKLQTAVASGLELPDVVNLEMTPRAMFLDFDAWERLDAEPYNLNKDELAPFSIPLITNPRGEITSVQIDNCVGGYVYNRELAKKYCGTDDPAEMEKLLPSLDSLVELSKKVAEQSGGQEFLYAGVDDAFMAAFGLYTTDAMVTDGKLTLDSSFLPAYEFCAKLVANNAVNKYMQWTPAWNTAFAQNNVVFWPGPSWYISFVVKANDPDSVGKYGFMTPPGGGFSWGGTSYSIPKSTTTSSGRSGVTAASASCLRISKPTCARPRRAPIGIRKSSSKTGWIRFRGVGHCVRLLFHAVYFNRSAGMEERFAPRLMRSNGREGI